MAEIVIKPPLNDKMDYDYIAFSFNGKHSYEDFGIVRTSDSDRYQINITPNMQDKTAEVDGVNGTYFFGTQYKSREFPISFAFDNLDDKKLHDLMSWLDGKDLHPLWFAEEPYKVYMAKVTGTPQLKVLPFNGSNGKRIYKGEGSVTFTAYNPLARTPDYVDGTICSYHFLAGQDNPQRMKDLYITSSSDRIAFYKLVNDTLITANVSNVYLWTGSGESLNKYSTSLILNPSKDGYNLLPLRFRGISFETDEISLVVVIYKGNGDMVFPVFTQCAYTRQPGNGIKKIDGRLASAYDDFPNKSQWIEASGLGDSISTVQDGTAPGPAEVSFYGWGLVDSGNG